MRFFGSNLLLSAKRLQMSLPLTLENVLLATKELLQVWINQILFYSDIYPQEIFEKVTSFGLIVYKSRSPSLNKYLNNLVDEFIKILIKGDGTGGGKVNQFVVVVYDNQSSKVLRRYILNFNEFVDLSTKITNFDFLNETVKIDKDISAKGTIDLSNFSWSEINTQFKSILYFHKFELNRIPPNADSDNFFKILINLSDAVDLNKFTSISNENTDASNWVKIARTNHGLSTTEKNFEFIPVGEVSVGFVCFNSHNEYIK